VFLGSNLRRRIGERVPRIDSSVVTASNNENLRDSLTSDAARFALCNDEKRTRNSRYANRERTLFSDVSHGRGTRWRRNTCRQPIAVRTRRPTADQLVEDPSLAALSAPPRHRDYEFFGGTLRKAKVIYLIDNRGSAVDTARVSSLSIRFTSLELSQRSRRSSRRFSLVPALP